MPACREDGCIVRTQTGKGEVRIREGRKIEGLPSPSKMRYVGEEKPEKGANGKLGDRRLGLLLWGEYNEDATDQKKRPGDDRRTT